MTGSWRCKNPRKRFLWCEKHQRWPLIRVAYPLVALFGGAYLLGWFGPQGSIKIEDLDRVQKNIEELRTFIEEHHGQAGGVKELPAIAKALEDKYPYGYALFYNDGRRTLYWGSKVEGLIFDPAQVEIVSMNSAKFCYSLGNLRLGGNLIYLTNNCVTIIRPGDALSVGSFGGYELWFESIPTKEGFGWVIGVDEHPSSHPPRFPNPGLTVPHPNYGGEPPVAPLTPP